LSNAVEPFSSITEDTLLSNVCAGECFYVPAAPDSC
jgi:hypothetical protein